MSSQQADTILTEIIGKSKADASEYCRSAGFKFRITFEDCLLSRNHFRATGDYDLKRVNVSITNDKVTEASLG